MSSSFASLNEFLVGTLEAWAATVPPPLFVVLYAVITCIPFPGTRLVAIAAGALYGPWLGFGLVYTGALLGATGGFLASRHLVGRRLEPWLRERMPGVFAETDRNATVYLWSLRLSPLFSFAMVHYAMALTRIPLARFLAVTAACSLLYSSIYVGLGGALAQAARAEADGASQGVPRAWLVAFFALSLVPFLFRRRRTPQMEKP
jgi:uncharacterized membrane protein YdjX (TVP38/TMEM64 family)